MKKRFLLFGSFLLLIGFLLGYMFSKVSRNNYAYLDEEDYLHLNKKCKLLTSHKKRNGFGIQFIPLEDVRYGMYPLCPSCITERDYELLKEKFIKSVKQEVSDKENKKSSGFIIYKSNGKTYKVPEDRIAEFENTYPDATVEIYDDNNEAYNLPVAEKKSFQEYYPNWSYDGKKR